MTHKRILLSLLVIGLLAQSPEPATKAQRYWQGPTYIPVVMSKPPGTVSGFIYSTPEARFCPDQPVWLAQIFCTWKGCYWILDSVLSGAGYTDEAGNFILPAVTPFSGGVLVNRMFVLATGMPADWSNTQDYWIVFERPWLHVDDDTLLEIGTRAIDAPCYTGFTGYGLRTALPATIQGLLEP